MSLDKYLGFSGFRLGAVVGMMLTWEMCQGEILVRGSRFHSNGLNIWISKSLLDGRRQPRDVLV